MENILLDESKKNIKIVGRKMNSFLKMTPSIIYCA